MSGRDLCRIIKKRITMSTPSRKSVIRRRKKGHFTDNDLSYHTFTCVVHQDSIGLRDDADEDLNIVVVAADAAEDLVDNSFIATIFLDASKLVGIILLCRTLVFDDPLDLAFVFVGNLSCLTISLLRENPFTKCERSMQQNHKRIAIISR